MVVFSVATGPRGEAIELRVEPSRLLYGIDRAAYIEVLRTADLVVAEEESRVKKRRRLLPSRRARRPHRTGWTCGGAFYGVQG